MRAWRKHTEVTAVRTGPNWAPRRHLKRVGGRWAHLGQHQRRDVIVPLRGVEPVQLQERFVCSEVVGFRGHLLHHIILQLVCADNTSSKTRVSEAGSAAIFKFGKCMPQSTKSFANLAEECWVKRVGIKGR